MIIQIALRDINKEDILLGDKLELQGSVFEVTFDYKELRIIAMKVSGNSGIDRLYKKEWFEKAKRI